jgi:hypothetical protein
MPQSKLPQTKDMKSILRILFSPDISLYIANHPMAPTAIGPRRPAMIRPVFKMMQERCASL